MNKVGEVTLYQTSRHGAWDDAGSPTHLYAIKPQVIVVNNGPRKGPGGTSPGFSEVSTAHYDRMAKSPGIEGIWQGHRSLLDPESGPQHGGRHDREPGRDRGVQRPLDSGVGEPGTARSPSRTAATGSAEPTRRAERWSMLDPTATSERWGWPSRARGPLNLSPGIRK